MNSLEFDCLAVGDLVQFGYGDVYFVDSLYGKFGIHHEDGWIEINPNSLDGWRFVGNEYKPDNTNGHCWHYEGSPSSSVFVPNYICCHCGKSVMAKPQRKDPPKGHGKYYPGLEIIKGYIWHGNDEPCEEKEESNNDQEA